MISFRNFVGYSWKIWRLVNIKWVVREGMFIVLFLCCFIYISIIFNINLYFFRISFYFSFLNINDVLEKCNN